MIYINRPVCNLQKTRLIVLIGPNLLPITWLEASMVCKYVYRRMLMRYQLKLKLRRLTHLILICPFNFLYCQLLTTFLLSCN